jgi:hypothetical protein
MSSRTKIVLPERVEGISVLVLSTSEDCARGANPALSCHEPRFPVRSKIYELDFVVKGGEPIISRIEMIEI